MPNRVRLYPYRVSYIDADNVPVSARAKVPIYTDVVRAENSKDAKKRVLSAQHPDRSLIFLNSTRHPDSWPRPDLCEFKKLTAYQIKRVSSETEKRVAAGKSLPTKKPIAPKTKVSKKVPVPKSPFKPVADLSVAGFTIAKEETVNEIMTSQPISYSTTAPTFPAVSPPNLVPFASQVQDAEPADESVEITPEVTVEPCGEVSNGLRVGDVCVRHKGHNGYHGTVLDIDGSVSGYLWPHTNLTKGTEESTDKPLRDRIGGVFTRIREYLSSWL